MTRKRHIENVNPREEYIKLLKSEGESQPWKGLFVDGQSKPNKSKYTH